MAIQGTHSQLTPTVQPHWGIGQWKNLTFQPCGNAFKILGLGLSLLILVGLAWRASKSRTSPEIKPSLLKDLKASSSTAATPVKNFANCVVYSEKTWNTLDKQVTLTDEDLAAFLAYPKGSETIVEAHAMNVKFFYGNCDESDQEQG